MKRTCLLFGIFLFFLPDVAGAEDDAERYMVERYRADLRRIEDHLNSIVTLEADFTATFPNGFISQGKAYLSRPGKMRVEFEPPMSVLVIADGSYLIHYDQELEQASWVDTSRAPVVELMVRPGISIDDDDFEIVRVEKNPDLIEVHVELPNAPPEQRNMTMTFSTAPVRLVQWIERGTPYGDVVVRFGNMSFNHPLPPDLFVFMDPRFNDPLSPRRRSR